MQFAPIALFVFNRPKHTERTLNALLSNNLINDSELYIFSDQAFDNDIDNQFLVNEVRALIKNRHWIQQPKVVERTKNFGLAKNIIDGIDYVLDKHNRIIVLEDDIVTSKGFLQYMNDALNFYSLNEKVMHISGYMFPVNKKLPETFFYNTASCWGWGTWKTAWKYYQPDTKKLLSYFDNESKVREFNIDNSHNFYSQLTKNHLQSLNTWAIKWYASIFIRSGLSLHPGLSLSENIGHDGTGVNSSNNNSFNHKKLASNINVREIPLEESKRVKKIMCKYYLNNQKKSIGQKIKKFLLSTLSEELIQSLKSNFSPKVKNQLSEIKKLKSYPRFIPAKSSILDQEISFNDSAALLFTYKEIFEERVYDFKCSAESPVIIDAGANIGLATIRFKSLYPNSKIIAIEADSDVCNHLQYNIDSFKLSNIQLINAALWNISGSILFNNAGADSGRIDSQKGDAVEAILLSDLITDEIDLIKMDIEGAELTVLREAKHKLHLVNRMFIEFHSFVNQTQKLSELLAILESTGFRYYLSSPGVTQKNPFLTSKKSSYVGMDFQLNIHAIKQ